MKTLALALLIPVAICTACDNKEGSLATAAPDPVDAAANPPAAGAAAAPDRATAQVNLTAAATAPAAGAAPAVDPPTAMVRLTSAPGSSVNGDLTLTGEGYAVAIRGQITGLAPGTEHGFHVHEVGECSLPDFKSAGDHLNPTNDPHGKPGTKARHLGDMPNVKADENGRVTVDVNVEGATLVDKDGGPNEILGKALVVHALPDDYKTQPSGGSGARIACGVIR